MFTGARESRVEAEELVLVRICPVALQAIRIPETLISGYLDDRHEVLRALLLLAPSQVRDATTPSNLKIGPPS